MVSIRPSFFIVGAPKAGTTALHAYLEKHPQVCMSSDKEPNYFTAAAIAAQELYYKKKNAETEQEYLQLFHPKTSTRIAGEASVSYLFYPDTAEKIHAFDPAAKIIIVLRDPVQRAFSHYQMDYSIGLLDVPFETIYRRGPGDTATAMYFQQYFLLSKYAEQVNRYLAVFPKDQVLLMLQEELYQQPAKTLSSLCSFLGIDPQMAASSMEQQNVSGAASNPLLRKLYQVQWLRNLMNAVVSESLRSNIKSAFLSKKNLPVLEQSMANELYAYYADDVKELMRITGLPVHHWLPS